MLAMNKDKNRFSTGRRDEQALRIAYYAVLGLALLLAVIFTLATPKNAQADQDGAASAAKSDAAGSGAASTGEQNGGEIETPSRSADVSSNDREDGADLSVKTEKQADPLELDKEIPQRTPAYHYTLCFAGDVSLADGAAPWSTYQSGGINTCFDSTLLGKMNGADVMCINSEFSFTTRGDQQVKNYTFRGDPARISVYDELGVDVAILANNHVYDYGEVGLQDTLDTFRNHGMPYVGAGENIDEASAIWYAELENCRVAYVAGCRIEWAQETRGATEERSGVFRTAESNALICQRIAEAKENADFVVVYIHWGMEGVEWLEDYQLNSGKEFIDAGADVVVGDHPHVVQGIEWYEGKPIFYSMGNYWFSNVGKDTMLLEVELDRQEGGDQTAQFRLVPAWTQNGKVRATTDSSAMHTFFQHVESISINASIDDEGIVTERV